MHWYVYEFFLYTTLLVCFGFWFFLLSGGGGIIFAVTAKSTLGETKFASKHVSSLTIGFFCLFFVFLFRPFVFIFSV